MIELVAMRYGVIDRHQCLDLPEALRLFETLRERGLALTLAIMDGDTMLKSYDELHSDWAAQNLLVDAQWYRNKP